jgi:hypothetical protein
MYAAPYLNEVIVKKYLPFYILLYQKTNNQAY